MTRCRAADRFAAAFVRCGGPWCDRVSLLHEAYSADARIDRGQSDIRRAAARRRLRVALFNSSTAAVGLTGRRWVDTMRAARSRSSRQRPIEHNIITFPTPFGLGGSRRCRSRQRIDFATWRTAYLVRFDGDTATFCPIKNPPMCAHLPAQRDAL